MIKEVLQTEQINTDADSSIKGIGLQKSPGGGEIVKSPFRE